MARSEIPLRAALSRAPGSEGTPTTPAGQFPALVDTPASILRNAIAIAQLLDLEPSRGTLARALTEIVKLNALALELLERGDRQGDLESARRELEEMDRTNAELRDLRLAHDGPAELEDADRYEGTGDLSDDSDDATGAR